MPVRARVARGEPAAGWWQVSAREVALRQVPVREQVSVPMEPTPKFLGLPIAPENGPPYALIGAGIVFLAALAGLALLALSLRDALRKRKEAANASEDQSS